MTRSAREALEEANDDLLSMIDSLEEISEDHDDLRSKLQQIIETLVNVSEQLDSMN